MLGGDKWHTKTRLEGKRRNSSFLKIVGAVGSESKTVTLRSVVEVKLEGQ